MTDITFGGDASHAPRMLERVEFAEKEWFIDRRLKELRNVRNPHERITFSEIKKLRSVI